MRINCVYTKNEVDNLTSNAKPDEYFKLRETDKLYLYKPSSITQNSEYYIMSWNIDSNYDIPQDTIFTFKDYLFGHTWNLKWDGDSWTGNNVVNLSFNKQSTTTNNYGSPALIIQHTDYMIKWIDCVLQNKDPIANENLATLLSKYNTNLRVFNKDGTIKELNETNSEV